MQNITLGVGAGEMLALVGPSGSGKTTLLRCIAGLETPDAGTISLGGVPVFSAGRGIDVPPERRDLGLIFQSYALWPHLTAERNVGYPLVRRRVPAEQRRVLVERYLALVGCGHLAHRLPHELSGGQQQRIALARALVYEPKLVLFDEPLSNLDPTLREYLRAQIKDLQRQLGFTGVYVTHDLAEAFYVAGKIALIHNGVLIQLGTPEDIYRNPLTPTVAQFVGATNALEGRIGEGGRVFCSAGLGCTPIAAMADGSPAREGPALLLARPEHVRCAPAAHVDAAPRIVDRVLVGHMHEYTVVLADGGRWRVRAPLGEKPHEAGAPVALALEPGDALVYAVDGS